MKSRRCICTSENTFVQPKAYHFVRSSERETGKADVRFGSLADICSAKGHPALPRQRPRKRISARGHVRFTPKSRHVRCNSSCLLWVISVHRACHSKTSSARPISVFGTLMPSALADFRLIYISTLVACWTGKSAGLSPLRMRPA
jgi:hypothetical protein